MTEDEEKQAGDEVEADVNGNGADKEDSLNETNSGVGSDSEVVEVTTVKSKGRGGGRARGRRGRRGRN